MSLAWNIVILLFFVLSTESALNSRSIAFLNHYHFRGSCDASPRKTTEAVEQSIDPRQQLGPAQFKLTAFNPDQQSEDSLIDPTFFSPNVPLESQQDRISGDNLENADPGDQNGVSSPSAINEYSFFDQAMLYVRAGSGGQGANTYKLVRGQNGPPDGGNGGNGGNVVLIVDPSLNTLAGLATSSSSSSIVAGSPLPSFKTFRAENGQDGDRQSKSGRFGKDVTIRVPPGTIVQEMIEIVGQLPSLLGCCYCFQMHQLYSQQPLVACLLTVRNRIARVRD